MNKYIYTVGSFALALVMSGMPAIALAENGSEGQVRVQAQALDASASVTAARESEEEDRATSTERAREEVSENAAEQARERSQSSLFLELEDEDMAFSLEDLKQKIEERRQELEDEEASTTPQFRNAMRNANEVRLAVHALLASRGLLGGGIGQQVSEIARHMNDSVASTTNAEVKMQSRGFFSRFLFGGDSTAAEMIAREASQNQERVQALTSLLAEAGVSVEVRAELEARIAALEAAQARLKVLAEKEQKAWGLFSWRF